MRVLITHYKPCNAEPIPHFAASAAEPCPSFRAASCDLRISPAVFPAASYFAGLSRPPCLRRNHARLFSGLSILGLKALARAAGSSCDIRFWRPELSVSYARMYKARGAGDDPAAGSTSCVSPWESFHLLIFFVPTPSIPDPRLENDAGRT